MADSPDDSPRHGGDLALATAGFGRPTDGWLDLSTGINPVPYPAPALAPADMARLPDTQALAALLAAAHEAYGIGRGVALLATPGTEIAIRLLPFAAPPGAVAVVGPTYRSHAEAWRKAGRTVDEIPALEAVPAHSRIVVLANPNNPDGRTCQPRQLAILARRLGEYGGLLVADEAFADVAPGVSLAPSLASLPALVLRSVGKFYGLAGLRLGFVAGVAPVVERLAALLGDWPVSGPAIAIGRAALADTAWHDATRRRLAADAGRLRSLLTGSGVAIRGGTDLFVLVHDSNARALHRGLAERGIWTRVFADRPSWLRVGLPGGEAAFARLQAALTAIRSGR